MTEKLKTLMHQSADVPFDPVDLDAVVGAGDRTIRRRRVVTGVAGLAAAAVVSAGGFAFLGDSGNSKSDVIDPATGHDQVVWTVGSTLHTTSGSRDLGHPVQALVRTSEGLVYADDAGKVRAEGVETIIGTTSSKYSYLVADPEGSLVGWVDSSAERPAFVVHDLATGETQSFDEHTEPGMALLSDQGDPAYFYAIDGRTAYWRDTRGAVATDVATGEARIVDAGARNGFDIGGVENGLLLFTDPETGIAYVSEAPRGEAEGQELEGAYGSNATFSPDARWVSIDADEPQVFDVRSGKQVRVDVGDRYYATGYEWLDESTLVMIAMRTEKSPLELLTCEVPAGTCEVAAEPGTVDELEGRFAIPVGSGLT